MTSRPVLAVDSVSFLKRYWQREPLYLPQGIDAFRPPADADELAGLALEPEVDARIISGSGAHWEARRGPFELEDLQRPGPWSLLVQAVDHYWEEAAELLCALPFLPRWRLSDVLMSYATDGGSAGPHYDQYDVFIIQGDGERHWRLGQRCDRDSPLMPMSELQLLAEFQDSAEYRMRCGDVLYIPPGVAHWGVSVGESTSFSIGLRAPRLADLLARWTDTQLERLDDQQLYRDAGREVAARPGEFTGDDLHRAREQILALLDSASPGWFGEVLTDTPGGVSFDEDALPLHGPLNLRAVPGRPIAWFDAGGELRVCAGGASRGSSAQNRADLEILCSGSMLTLPAGGLAGPRWELLDWLREQGALERDHD